MLTYEYNESRNGVICDGVFMPMDEVVAKLKFYETSREYMRETLISIVDHRTTDIDLIKHVALGTLEGS